MTPTKFKADDAILVEKVYSDHAVDISNDSGVTRIAVVYRGVGVDPGKIVYATILRPCKAEDIVKALHHLADHIAKDWT